MNQKYPWKTVFNFLFAFENQNKLVRCSIFNGVSSFIPGTNDAMVLGNVKSLAKVSISDDREILAQWMALFGGGRWSAIMAVLMGKGCSLLLQKFLMAVLELINFFLQYKRTNKLTQELLIKGKQIQHKRWMTQTQEAQPKNRNSNLYAILNMLLMILNCKWNAKI